MARPAPLNIDKEALRTELARLRVALGGWKALAERIGCEEAQIFAWKNKARSTSSPTVETCKTLGLLTAKLTGDSAVAAVQRWIAAAGRVHMAPDRQALATELRGRAEASVVSPEKQEQQIAAELGDWGQRLFEPVVAEFLNYGRHYISCVWPFEASEACERLSTHFYKERLQNLLRQPSLRAPGARDTYLRTLIKTPTPPTDEEKMRLTEAWRAIIASDDPDRFELYVPNPTNIEPVPSFPLCQLHMSLWAFNASEKVQSIVLYENRDILYLAEHQSAPQTETVKPSAYAFSMLLSEPDSILALDQHGFLPDRPDRKHACFWRPNANIWERIGVKARKQGAEA